MERIEEKRGPLDPDLKINIHRSSTICPSEETERRSMFLSNIDQLFTFDVNMIHFFTANPVLSPEVAVEMIEMVVSKLLVAYDYAAGRLKFNTEESRLEIDCNGAGIGFCVASSELTLEEMGDFFYNNLALQQLIDRKYENLSIEDKPLIYFQVTSFKCGGFAIGLGGNHTILDGASTKMFFENVASLAYGNPLSITPYNNRKLLAARSPPSVTFPHPELVKIELPTKENVKPATIFDTGVDNLTFKILRLSANNIIGLKEKARAQGANGPATTGFNVVTAHIWRCKVLATMASSVDPDKLSRVLYPIDMRSRLQPPLPQSYTGNAVLMAYGSAKYCLLEKGPFGDIVEAVREGVTRMTDEYARSFIDCMELYKRFPRGDVVITSWWKLGFAEVEYPIWGRPIYSCRVMTRNSANIALVPDKKGMGGDNGLNVYVGLPEKNMAEFERLFYEFLA